MEYVDKEMYTRAIRELSKKKIYIVGAGKYGEILGKYFDNHNILWEGYVDQRAELGKVNGKPVYAYGENKDGYYVISSFDYREEMIKELKTHGIKMSQMILYGNQKIFYDIYEDFDDWKIYADKIKRFYRKHEGKRCFVIGNGPSLKMADLEKLKEEFTFVSNSIYALYKYTVWRPTYYCAMDPVFCKEMMSEKKDLQVLLQGCEAAFATMLGESISFRDDEDMKKLYYMKFYHEKSLEQGMPFSEDCSKKVYGGHTIAYVMLQLAVYMGFETIYLLGMDCNYSVEQRQGNVITRKNICNHMKEIEEEEKRFYKATYDRYGEIYMAKVDLQLKNYETARKYADEHNIKIYNATRGGKLEVFPRVNFDELFD